MVNNKYRMRVVRGAFEDSAILDQLGAKTIEKIEDEWQSIDEAVVDLEQVKKLQQNMIRHYNDPNIPWYMDGCGVEDSEDIIVAFGGDDGEGGKIFQFRADDKEAVEQVIEYGVSKGIPKEQLDFMDIKF